MPYRYDEGAPVRGCGSTSTGSGDGATVGGGGTVGGGTTGGGAVGGSGALAATGSDVPTRLLAGVSALTGAAVVVAVRRRAAAS